MIVSPVAMPVYYLFFRGEVCLCPSQYFAFAPVGRIIGSPFPESRYHVTEQLRKFADDDVAVRALVLGAIEAMRSDNFAHYFDFFSDDARWMMPAQQHDVDITAARRFYRFTSKFRFDQTSDIHEMVIDGDTAYVRLTFDGQLRPKAETTQPPIRAFSRHIWILRRQRNGVWKIIRDIWNTPGKG
ncbi:MAG: nuclear transport factor 2 family protein [Pseudomonadales bacterium]|nr:nuclear transport factor 2 family protein [Pseudomonadales bacterium]